MEENLSPNTKPITMVDSPPDSTKTAKSDRDNNFNLIRLLLAAMVIVSHSPELMDGNRKREILTSIFHTLSFGEVAVDSFFLLSGYLIVQSWDRAPTLLNFITKRILRIYPGFIVATLICAVVVGPLGAHPHEYFSQLSWLDLLKGALTLDKPDVPLVFQGSHDPTVDGAMWTIRYEFICYLIVALLGICGFIKNKGFWLAVFAVAFLANVNHAFVDDSLLLGDRMVRLFMYFSAGGCFYLFRERLLYKPIIAFFCALVLIVCLFFTKLAEPAFVTLGAYILFWFAFESLPALNRFKSNADISYGIYLYGWPSQKLLLWYFPTISLWLLTIIALCSSAFLGYLSWHLVEHPFLRLKPRSKPLDATQAN